MGMTEAEWMACTDLGQLVYFLGGRVNDRKWRLFAVACCRSIEHLLVDERCRHAIDVTERLADNEACRGEAQEAHRLACAALAESRPERKRDPVEDVLRVLTNPTLDPKTVAHGTAMSVVGVLGEQAWKAAMGHGRRTQDKKRGQAWQRETAQQVALLRDVVGNPFRRPMLDTAWLTWNDGAIVKLAQTMYVERRSDLMAALGAALSDAGCTETSILEHCGLPNHVTGCWLVDALLGKDVGVWGDR